MADEVHKLKHSLIVAVVWRPEDIEMKHSFVKFHDGSMLVEIDERDIPELIEWLKTISK